MAAGGSADVTTVAGQNSHRKSRLRKIDGLVSLVLSFIHGGAHFLRKAPFEDVRRPFANWLKNKILSRIDIRAEHDRHVFYCLSKKMRLFINGEGAATPTFT
jgi:hypothetical protein